MSSCADPSNLVSLHLAGSSTHWDSRFNQMLAISLLVHAVLFFGLMSLRLAPTIQQPIASYYVDLVAVPESQVALPKQESKPVKKAPIQPPVKPEPKPQAKPHLPPPEPVTQSIVSAVESVAFPQSREMTPIKKTHTLPPKTKLLPISKVGNPSMLLPVVPQVPELSTLSSSSQKVSPMPMKSTSSGSLEETLKQTMKSVTIPHKVPKQQVPISTGTKPTVSSTKARPITSPKIIIPGQAPRPFKDVSVSKTKKVQPIPRTGSRVSDSLKQVMQSVIVPEVKGSTVPKYTPAVAVPVPSRQELKSTLPQKTPEIVPEPRQLDLSQQIIAKLVIPEVKEFQTHHVLSSATEGGMQKTTTALQVSGISSKGNVYWGRLWSKIDREWIAPAVDVRSNQPIHVLLAFRIERNGAVKNLSIEESSGNKYYDLAAKRAVIDATPLPAFPSNMLELYYDIQFQFTVNLDPLS